MIGIAYDARPTAPHPTMTPPSNAPLNIRDLRYLLALVEHRHFGQAARACGVSQPTLSVQIRKLEDQLGLALFERAARAVTPTAACRALTAHARDALTAADAILATARNLQDPLAGPFRLGVIPTLAPYLLPLVFAPLQAALPRLQIEPWEDQTAALLDRLAAHELDAALLATAVQGPDLTDRPLFEEPFLAALPPDHPLLACATDPAAPVSETDLARDILVLSDGHCLRDQALEACRSLTSGQNGSLRASSLPTLLNMVAAGYGTTLIPALAAGAAQDAGLTLRPLTHPASRTIRLTTRASHPRRQAVDAVGDVIAGRLKGFAEGAGRGVV